MRIVYICPFTGLCGGIKVIAEHVSRLAARNHSVEWWGLQPPPAWFVRPVPYRQFPNTNQLGAALQAEVGAALVATWWQTALWVAPSLRHGSRGFYLVQDIDQETYSHDSSGSSYKLGLKPITEGEWVTIELRRRWNLDPINVGIAIDHAVFRPAAIDRDINRVFTTYRPAAGPDDLKGWNLALEVARHVHRENPQAGLVTFGNQGPPKGSLGIPHIHVDSPTDAKLRELYSQAGVYLMTSKHEGFGLPAAESMACGTPVVCTDAHGNREFCKHGETALLGATAQDLASHILTLQHDPEAHRRFAEAGRSFVTDRYQWDRVTDCLEAAYAPLL